MLLNPYRFGPPPPGPSATGLISYWKLDEASGNAIDAHGANTLTDNNTVTSAAGKIATARQFARASTEYLSIASNASLQLGDIEFAVTAWVKWASFGTLQFFVAKDNRGGSRELAIYFDPANSRISAWITTNGTTTIIVVANALGAPVIGNWYFVVFWHDPNANRIFLQVNNGGIDFVAINGGAFVGTAEFRIGAVQFSPPDSFDGLIDEVGFWKRMPTPVERTQLYNQGNGLPYPFSNAPVEFIATDGNFKVHTFIGDGTFSVTGGAKDCQVLIVGGGGAGGRVITDGNGGGGGGAGQVRAVPSTVLALGDYPVVVGDGGISTLFVPDATHDGKTSSFAGFTALGGGAGGGSPTSSTGNAGRAGASGGGGCAANAGGAGSAGNSGGTGIGSGTYSGGGGGGAGGAGVNGSVSGAGGAGISSSITGTAVFYGGGGGGGKWGATGAAGGAGGGGNGSTAPGYGMDGTANSGGGGGGASAAGSGGGNGGRGGSGVVIIRYQFQ